MDYRRQTRPTCIYVKLNPSIHLSVCLSTRSRSPPGCEGETVIASPQGVVAMTDTHTHTSIYVHHDVSSLQCGVRRHLRRSRDCPGERVRKNIKHLASGAGSDVNLPERLPPQRQPPSSTSTCTPRSTSTPRWLVPIPFPRSPLHP